LTVKKLKPTSRILGQIPRKRGQSFKADDFKHLERQPGVTVKETTTRILGRYRTAQARVLRYPTDPTWTELLQGAKVTFSPWLSQTISESYSGMDKYYREYRRNFLVRGAINALAYWTTKEGFETIIETPDGKDATETNSELKAHIDRINAHVNLDWKLQVAIIKAKIHGKAGFEIERDRKGQPLRLLALDSTALEPLVDSNWQLKGFSYQGRGTLQDPFYLPEEVLYITNSELEDDWQGFSDIEPILKEAQLDDKILREDLTEAATTMWAGVVLWMLDVDKLPEGTTESEIQEIINDHIASIRPGASIATDNRWIAQPVDINPDLEKLLRVQESMERRILGNFGVPGFLLNVERRSGWNRATAYTELEAFVDGPITNIQRWLKRKIEDQWYNRLTREYLERNGNLTRNQPLPVLVKHRWKEIRTADWFQLFETVADAYAEGTGFIDRKKATEIMRDGKSTSFNPEEIAKDATPSSESVSTRVLERRLKRALQPQA